MHLAYRWFCRLDLEDDIRSLDLLGQSAGVRERRLRHVSSALSGRRWHGPRQGWAQSTQRARSQRSATREGTGGYGVVREAAADRAVASLRRRDREPNPERRVPKVISPSDPSRRGRPRPTNGSSLVRAQLRSTSRTPSSRCRGDAGQDLRRGGGDEDHDRPDRAVLALRPKRLAADTAYGTGSPRLARQRQRDHAAHPVWEKSHRADGISRGRTHLGQAAWPLHLSQREAAAPSGTVLTGARCSTRPKRDCDVCPLRSRCCTREEARRSLAILTRMPAMWLAGR